MQKALTILVWIFLANNLFAKSVVEQGIPFMHHYTYKDYNGSPQVWCAIQDQRGIMYFGDNGGVLEFDGCTWQHINTPKVSVVRSMDIDSAGIVYVGANNEFGYLEPNKLGKTQYISLSDKLPENERKFQNVWKTFTTTEGVYYFTLNQIFRYHNNKITTIKADLLSWYAYKIDDTIYVIVKDKGICTILDSTLVPVKDLDNGKMGTSFIELPNNRILKRNSLTSLILFNRTTQEFEKFNTDAQEYLNVNQISFISRIDELKFAVVTKNGGIVILSNSGKLLQIINKQSGLTASNIYSLFVDGDQNLWVCSNNGITKIDINYPAFKFDSSKNIDAYVLTSCNFNGRKYIGTMSGLYYLSEFSASNNYNQSFIPIDLKRIPCWDLLPTQNILFGCGTKELFIVQDTVKKTILTLDNKSSRCLCINPKFTDLLFFEVDNKLSFIRLNANADFKSLKVLENFTFPEINARINKITPDNNGNLWLSTVNGGIYFIRFLNSNPKNYRVTHLGTQNGLTELGYTRASVINNEVLIATDKGIKKPEFPENMGPDSLIHFKDADLLGVQVKGDVNQIMELADNKYLINGNSISYIRKSEEGTYLDSGVFNRLKKEDEIFLAFKNDDGSLSFGGSENYFYFSTNSKSDLAKPFHVAIRKVTIDNDSVLFNGSFYRLSDTLRIPVLNQTKENIPEIDFKLNSVTIQYSGLFYEEPQETQYSYKLVGYSKKWSEWSNENKAVFTNLKKGDYSFQVKARNIYLAESKVAVYQFKIHHAWYVAWWAYLVYFLILTGFTLLVVKVSVYRLKKQKGHLETIVNERTKEINLQKERIAQQNSQLEKFNKDRVKELQAFFALSKVVEDNNINTDKICRALLQILSQSFQFPDITYVRISIFDKIFESENYTDFKWRLSAPIKIGDSEQGKIDVVYSEEKPNEYEGPFLEEERLLINAMAERLGDIIKRLQGEEKIRENKERLQNIFNNLQDAYFEADLKGKFTTISPSAITMYGCYSFEEMQNLRAQDLYADPQDRERLFTLLNEKKSVSDFVCLGKRKDDSTFWVSMSVQFKYNNDGEISGTIGLVRDITERKDSEVSIEESEFRLKLATTSANLGIWDWNLVENKMIWDEKMFGLYGISKTDFPNSIIAWENGLHPDDKQRAIDECNAAINGEKEFDTVFRVLHPNGKILHLKANATVIFDDNKKPIRMVGINRDITEAKLAEEQLLIAKDKAEESDRLKSAFLANMSHEIRTPLNSIIGFSELLGDPDFKLEQKTEFTKAIVENGNNLLAIINDIMDLSMLEARQIKIKKERFEIKKLLSDIENEFSTKVNNVGLVLQVNILSDDAKMIIECDYYRIRQIFVNLMNNALKFTHRGFIAIGFSPIQNGVEFFVKDTGIGIASKFHNDIFERFRQVDETKTRKYGGNGLGLAISKNLVEVLGGKIWVESDLGQGSTFYFTIPRI